MQPADWIVAFFCYWNEVARVLQSDKMLLKWSKDATEVLKKGTKKYEIL